ncbi:MAG: MFS transporter [Candidatus Bathyarchaeota archaeon]|nr:MFS transporter [Candidatus Bathyarchaeota archaeon]
MKPESREYLLMIIGGTLTMFAGGLVQPIFAPFVRKEFTAPIFLVGLAVSGYFVVRMMAEFPIGVLSDRIAIRRLLIVGRFFGIFGALACYLTTDIGVLIVARALWGVGDASYFCIGMTYVASLFPNKTRGKYLGLFQAVELTGSFLGQTAAGFLAASLGLRVNFLISSAVGLAALGVVLLVRGSGQQLVPGSLSSVLPSRAVLKGLLNRTLVACCLINFVCMMMNNGLMGTLMPLYVTEQLAFSLAGYGLLVSLSTAGNISGNLFGGTLSDRLGRRRVLAGGFVVGALSLVGLALTQSFEWMLPMMFLNGFFWGIVYGVTPAFIADSVPGASRGMAIGTYRTFFDFGGVVGPIFFTAVLTLAGVPFGYVAAFYVGAAMLVVNLLLVLQLREKTQP